MTESLNLSRLTLEELAFAKYQLGVDIYKHHGQVQWLEESGKHMVNILRPGNQWGKTLILAIKHIYHAMTKYELQKFKIGQDNPLAWLKADYTTLNFGKTYEIAKGVHETIVDLVNGEYALIDPDTGEMTLNDSKIASAIRKEYSTELPYIIWWNNSVTLTRSTDDLGSSFKRRRLAFASGDEIGDIPDILSVLNATVIPRIAFYQGKVDLVGTPQDPGEYTELIELAKKHMQDKGEASQYYVQEGSMYQNPGLSKDYIKQIEGVADPNLRRRIVYGEVAATGERYFSLNQIQNSIQEDLLNYNEETGMIEPPLNSDQAKSEKAWYMTSADFAAVNDRTVFGIIRFDCYPARLVFLRFFKGRDVPIPMQYQILREVHNMYLENADRAWITYDANALGGKNADAQLRDLHGLDFPPKGMSPFDAKANALGALKQMMDEGRRVIEKDGEMVDTVPTWGGLWLPNVRELRMELEGYKLDDKKIHNDFVMMLAQAAFFINKKKPKEGFKRIKNIDFARSWLPKSGTINARAIDKNERIFGIRSQRSNLGYFSQTAKRRVANI